MQIEIQRCEETGMMIVDFAGNEYRLEASPEALSSFGDWLRDFCESGKDYAQVHLDLDDTEGGDE